MALFIVRVELHEVNSQKPSGEDYSELHLAMQRRQYFRVIKADEGKWYHLPHAEYTVTWDATRKDVLDEVVGIAASVWQKAGVLVTESKGCTWRGLKEASASQVNHLTRTDV